MALTIKVRIAMVRNSFGIEASRLSLLDHGPKSNGIGADSRMMGQPEVICHPDRMAPEKRCRFNWESAIPTFPRSRLRGTWLRVRI
jgi:hypothetical protein